MVNAGTGKKRPLAVGGIRSSAGEKSAVAVTHSLYNLTRIAGGGGLGGGGGGNGAMAMDVTAVVGRGIPLAPAPVVGGIRMGGRDGRGGAETKRLRVSLEKLDRCALAVSLFPLSHDFCL